MTHRISDLERWMSAREDEHLEFKEANNRFDFEELVRYCIALANERGGKMILGVTNKQPRRVVGSRAFPDLGRTKAGLMERIPLRIEVEELDHPDGRVLVLHVPSRPLGLPLEYRGAYWMRRDEQLVPMVPQMLQQIFAEATPDFSAEVVAGATLTDLDMGAVEQFRELWIRKSANRTLASLSTDQLLEDAGVVRAGAVTCAALALFGTAGALRHHLPQAEIIFEYRFDEASIPSQQRNEYREGFFLFRDSIWDLINLRNEVQQFSDGLYVWDIRTFNERVVREAILNAVSHRDYRHPGSIFVRQFPRKLEIISPGGFPDGITPQNAVYRQVPRNRCIAEALALCGLVERAGQGMDVMFRECIRESKAKPDFTGTDGFQVRLTLPGDVQDERFLRFLEKIGEDELASFGVEDFLVLDLIHHQKRIPRDLRHHLGGLIEHGIIESVGGGRYLLSQRFYSFLGQKGAYTRRRGLDRETNKQLLLKHIRDNAKDGSRLEDLMQVLPSLTRSQVQTLLKELKAYNQIFNLGRTRGARWYPSVNFPAKGS